MDIPYLINLLQNKFNYLNNARSAAAAVGDVSGVISIEQEILTTQNTLAQLQLLQSINQAAAATNTSATEVIASGICSSTFACTASDILAVISVRIYPGAIALTVIFL